uniref:Choline/carnitine acyltransferase domain-containing protein n=1 Tax=Glossina brevipalpis TaxID=37001 RepID=A0A1A9WIF7_9MUSC
MDRASIYFLGKNERNTYEFDEELPPLPLPELRETMQRYYEIIKPFGTEEELANSRKVIENFEKGVGPTLQAELKERSSKMKNWLGEWWEMYGYHTSRVPLYPTTVMAMPAKLECVNVPETPEYALKNLARLMYHSIEFWDLLRKGALKPLSSNNGKIKYSSNLYKRFHSTTRVPGINIDHIEKHFKSVDEGKTPSHGLISGKGRFFIFETLRENDALITPQELLILVQRLRSILDYEPSGDAIAILSHDNRNDWAQNRLRLQEISTHNKNILQLIESSNIVVVLDENEPQDYEEISRLVVTGDFHSKWADRSSILVSYKNGKFGWIGEHSCYDGTISVSFSLFVQLSLLETPEPDWSEAEKLPLVALKELKFDINDIIRNEIERVQCDCNNRRTSVLVTHEIFDDYGKEYIKQCKLHPDSFVQVIMQLAYAEMHNEIAPTYETALMRHFYDGRTETLRSCTNEVYNFIKIALNKHSSKTKINQAFRAAVQHHKLMMDEARSGKGVDRHLFGLWCVAYRNQMKIPDLYSDPLYLKSGGGGNFLLSTSTLGYTVNVGFVAPIIHILVSSYNDSKKTSAPKFIAHFTDAFRKFKSLLDEAQSVYNK